MSADLADVQVTLAIQADVVQTAAACDSPSPKKKPARDSSTSHCSCAAHARLMDWYCSAEMPSAGHNFESEPQFMQYCITGVSVLPGLCAGLRFRADGHISSCNWIADAAAAVALASCHNYLLARAIASPST